MDLSNLDYKAIRDYVVNQDLLAKLTVAVADAAVTVYTESPSTASHAERAAYAVEAAKSPESVAKQMAWVVVLLSDDDADATLKTVVLNVWNVFAGIG